VVTSARRLTERPILIAKRLNLTSSSIFCDWFTHHPHGTTVNTFIDKPVKLGVSSYSSHAWSCLSHFSAQKQFPGVLEVTPRIRISKRLETWHWHLTHRADVLHVCMRDGRSCGATVRGSWPCPDRCSHSERMHRQCSLVNTSYMLPAIGSAPARLLLGVRPSRSLVVYHLKQSIHLRLLRSSAIW
jgi:hypothetical protein